MTFWMPKPGMMAAGGVALETPSWVQTGALVANTAQNQTAIPTIAGTIDNLAIMYAMWSTNVTSTRGWYGFWDCKPGDGSATPYETAFATHGGNAASTVFQDTLTEGMFPRVITAADVGANISANWGSIPKVSMFQAMEFSGCRTSPPYWEFRPRSINTTNEIPAILDRYYYNGQLATTLNAPPIKVTGTNRLGVTHVVFFASSGSVVTPPAGWTLIGTRTTTVGYDCSVRTYTKELNADEPSEAWTVAASNRNWCVYNYALLPAGAADPGHVNVTSLPNTAGSSMWGNGMELSARASTATEQSVAIQQLPNAGNRLVYWEILMKYFNPTLSVSSKAGMSASAAELGALGTIVNTFGCAVSGAVTVNGPTKVADGTAATGGDKIIMWAYDRDGGQAWQGVDGVWSRDPLTLSGNVTGLGADWFPAVNSSHYATTWHMRMHTPELTYTPPTGYKAYAAK